MGNGKKIEGEAIENFRLLLMTGFYLDLDETFIFLSFRKKFDFYFYLRQMCFFFSFSFFVHLGVINSSNDSKLVSSSYFSGDDNLYLLDTIVLFNKSIQLSTRGIKRKLTNENSAV